LSPGAERRVSKLSLEHLLKAADESVFRLAEGQVTAGDTLE
jgi:hypothetical protein